METKRLDKEIQTVTMSLRNVERLLTTFQTKIPDRGIDYLKQDQQFLKQKLALLQDMAGRPGRSQL